MDTQIDNDGFLPGMRAIPREKNDLLTDEEKAAFDRTPTGREIIDAQRIFCRYRDTPAHPEVIKYWRELGVEKTLYPAGTGGAVGEFSVFVPASKARECIPAVYVMCGRNHPIMLAETYGFNRLCAKEGFAAIYPSPSRTVEDAFYEYEHIMAFLPTAGVNIDTGRVYLFGYAAGGDRAIGLALKSPESFAALSPSPGCAGFPDDENDAALRRAAALAMPIVCVSGTRDGGSHPLPGDSERQLKGLENGLKAAGLSFAQPLTPQLVQSIMDGGNPPLRVLGLPFARAYTRGIGGADWHFGEGDNEHGVCTVRFARCDGLSHYMCPAGARIVWDFFKGFRRTPDGRLERLISNSGTGSQY